MIKNLLISMRPKQWSKNILVFAGLLFAKDFMILSKIIESFVAFVIFCLASSSAYLLNDIVDHKSDAQHPTKRNRPIASGALSPLLVKTHSVNSTASTCGLRKRLKRA